MKLKTTKSLITDIIFSPKDKEALHRTSDILTSLIEICEENEGLDTTVKLIEKYNPEVSFNLTALSEFAETLSDLCFVDEPVLVIQDKEDYDVFEDEKCCKCSCDCDEDDDEEDDFDEDEED